MYKYKSANKRDIAALLENKLWISTLEHMNDPMDLGFYIKKSKHTDEEIIGFQKSMNTAFVVISLSRTVQNRRLWNYYTAGMKGFVLKYNNQDLINALKKSGATRIIHNPVKYSDKKTDLTDLLDEYIEAGKAPTLTQAEVLFIKDDSWQSEDEYRIITESSFLEKYPDAVSQGGICLENVIPVQIVVGYRMDNDTVEAITEYAQQNGIEVRKFTPDFRSESSRQYTSIIIQKKAKDIESVTAENEEEPSSITDNDKMNIQDL